MIRKIAAAVIALSVVPAAAFACDHDGAGQSAKLEKPAGILLAQAESAKKEGASMTAQTQTNTAQTAQTAQTAGKKAKPKAKSLSAPKTATPNTK